MARWHWRYGRCVRVEVTAVLDRLRPIRVSHTHEVQDLEIRFTLYDKAMLLVYWGRISVLSLALYPERIMKSKLPSGLKQKKWPIICNNLETEQDTMQVNNYYSLIGSPVRPKSVTLNGPGRQTSRRPRRHFSLSDWIQLIWGTQNVKVVEDKPYCLQKKHSPKNHFSAIYDLRRGVIRIDYRERVPKREAPLIKYDNLTSILQRHNWETVRARM